MRNTEATGELPGAQTRTPIQADATTETIPFSSEEGWLEEGKGAVVTVNAVAAKVHDEAMKIGTTSDSPDDQYNVEKGFVPWWRPDW
jgi:hypothetical protein